MKDAQDSSSAGASAAKAITEERPEGPGTGVEREGFGNRKLIRPSLPPRERGPEFGGGNRGNPKKTSPPEQTFAESFYYQKQMQTRTPMVVVMQDGEELRGIIEWYDKDCIKLNRSAHQPNLLVYKSCIKYIFKQSESNGRK